ncbi:MAG: guanine deaminase [Geminicoccaceae bacterium]
MSERIVRGRLLDFLDDPERVGDEASYRYIEDGFLHLKRGRIEATGEASAMPLGLPVDHYPNALILPGLIDTHLHYPQTQVVASYGARLLDWLANYTFAEEQRFADAEHCQRIAAFFLDELLRNGTTTAAVYCTVHKASVEALFAEAHRRDMAMIAGKVMMDQGAPPGLLDTAEASYRDTKELIDRWHGIGRQHYAITPRFALTSSDAQLEAAGTLLREHSECYLQTHLSETPEEVRTALERHPGATSYTDIYDRKGLLGPRSIFGHCLHLDLDERRRMAETGSVVAFCPTSNLFLGSGLLTRRPLKDQGIPVTIATDIGGGTSYSMLRTAAEAYKVLQMNRETWSALAAFHDMTRGNAQALGLAHEIGTLAPGSAADLVVLDACATPAMAHRMERVADRLDEELFVLMTMGDDRSVVASYVAGDPINKSGPTVP